MTHDEYQRVSASLDNKLKSKGLDTEWAFLLGIMLGRLQVHLGSWEEVDMFLSDWCAVANAGKDLYKMTLEEKK